MALLPVTMAAVNYDRFQPLIDGRIRAEGIELEILPMEVEEIFYRQAKYAEFDVSEMSLSTYTLSLEDEDFPFVAIPVFPSRYFRHQSIYVRADAGISEPADLKGARVGLPEYQITAAVWLRGILEDHYGVAPRDLDFFIGGVDAPGRAEKRMLDLPSDVRTTKIGRHQTLSRMLLDGDLDAVFTAHEPQAFLDHPDRVTRLFGDYKAVEKAYFAQTGIFPIMHIVVIRKPMLSAHPWIARSLLKAFTAALSEAKRDLFYRSSLKTMLPWLADHVDETVASLGDDYWSYGIQPNRTVLDTFLRYHHKQGLSPRQYAAEDLFAPSTHSEFVI